MAWICTRSSLRLRVLIAFAVVFSLPAIADRDGAPISTRAAELIQWIGENSDFDVSDLEPPRIEFRSRAEMASMMHLGLAEAADWPLALHGDDTIYLEPNFKLGLDDWVLLHEIVHYVQLAAGADYPCPELAERAAYELQVKFAHERGGRIPSDLFVRLLTCPD